MRKSAEDYNKSFISLINSIANYYDSYDYGYDSKESAHPTLSTCYHDDILSFCNNYPQYVKYMVDLQDTNDALSIFFSSQPQSNFWFSIIILPILSNIPKGLNEHQLMLYMLTYDLLNSRGYFVDLLQDFYIDGITYIKLNKYSWGLKKDESILLPYGLNIQQVQKYLNIFDELTDIGFSAILSIPSIMNTVHSTHIKLFSPYIEEEMLRKKFVIECLSCGRNDDDKQVFNNVLNNLKDSATFIMSFHTHLALDATQLSVFKNSNNPSLYHILLQNNMSSCSMSDYSWLSMIDFDILPSYDMTYHILRSMLRPISVGKIDHNNYLSEQFVQAVASHDTEFVRAYVFAFYMKCIISNNLTYTQQLDDNVKFHAMFSFLSSVLKDKLPFDFALENLKTETGME